MKNLTLILSFWLFVFFPGYSQTIVTQDITANTVWESSGSPYIIQRELLTINEGVTLNIRPNVVVKLGDWRTSLLINGSLIAESGGSLLTSSPASVVFTSYKDDAHGGDSNNNGNADSPAPWDWTSIIVGETGYASFRQSLFLYGGDNFGNTMLEIFGGIDTIWNCRFAESNANAMRSHGKGIHMEYTYIETGGGISILGGEGKEISLFNNYISVATTPLGINSGEATVRLRDNNLTHAATSGVHANGCMISGIWTGNSYFYGDPDFPFFVSNALIESGASLTLPEGTIMKFGNSSGMSIEGSLYVDGEPGNPVVFTSLKDDDFGGDTNGDGSMTAPSRGSWGPLVFKGSDPSHLENLLIKYGGEWDWGMTIENSNVLVDNCVIAESGRTAVFIKDSNPEIRNSTFSNNVSAIYVNHSSMPLIYDNDFMFNGVGNASGDALSVDPIHPGIVDIEDNYWASTFGPFNYNSNPGSPGQKVSGPVDYEPWETGMVNREMISKPLLDIEKSGNQVTCRQTFGFSFTDFMWDFGDGQTSSSAIGSHTYTDAGGLYEVCYSATAEYGIRVKQCQQVDLSTSLEDPRINMSIRINPNPAHESLHIELDIGESVWAEAVLLDMCGAKIATIYSGPLASGPVMWVQDVSGLEPGIYILSLCLDDRIMSRRVIVF